MARFIKGDVIVIPFPFSDLSQNKRRPALVVANLKGDDLILCQITSKNIFDNHAEFISEIDFEQGTLKQESNIRPNKLFTADENIILYKAGHLKEQKVKKVTEKIIKILTQY